MARQGQHQRCAGPRHQHGQTLVGQRRIERHVGCADLEQGQQTDQRLGRALQADADDVLGTDRSAEASGLQHMGELIGPVVQFSIAPALDRPSRLGLPAHRGLVGRGRDLRLEQPGVHGIARVGGGVVVPVQQHLCALGVGQQRQLPDRLAGVGDDGVEQRPEMPGHALDRGALEQVGVVLEHGVQARVDLVHHQGQVVLGHPVLDHGVFGAQALQRQRMGAVGQQVEHHLEDGGVRQRPLGAQRLHQRLEGQCVALESVEVALAHPGQQLTEAGVARDIGAQHERIEEQPDQGLGFGELAVGAGRADHDVVLTGVAGQQHREHGLHDHEQRGVLGPPQVLERFRQLGRQQEDELVANTTLHCRAGVIGRQGQQWRRAVQPLSPVVQLRLQDRSAQPFPLPERVVGVLHRQCGQAGRRSRSPRHQRSVQRGQLVHQDAHGPAVGDRVVQRQGQDMVCRGQAQQRGIPQRAVGEVEGLVALLPDLPRDFGLLSIVWPGGQVGDGEPEGRRMHALTRLALLLGKAGSQRRVACLDSLERLLQGRDLQRAVQVNGGWQVVEARIRLELSQEPQPLLGEGKRHGRGGGARHQRHTRILAVGDAAREALQVGDGGREPGHGGFLEDGLHGQRHVEHLAGVGDDLGRQQGMSAQFPEIVVHPDVGDTQQLLPDPDQALLDAVMGGYIGVPTHAALRLRQDAARGYRCRQCLVRWLVLPPVQACLQVAGGQEDLRMPPAAEHSTQRGHALFGLDGEAHDGAAGPCCSGQGGVAQTPAVPVQADPGQATALAACGDETVQRYVGRTVGPEAHAAEHGSQRREGDAEVERLAVQQAVEHLGAPQLGAEVRCAIGHLRGLEEAARRLFAGDAGGVEHAVQRTEGGLGGAQGRTELGLVGHVGAQGQHLRARLLDGQQPAQSAADGVVFGVRGQPGCPVLPWRDRGAPDQDQPGAPGGEMLGQEQSDLA